MPNGYHAPQCGHCKHWIPAQKMRELFGDEKPNLYKMSKEDREAIERQIYPADWRFCDLHSFVMPWDVAGEIICADFEWADSGSALTGSALEPHLEMQPGLLYHHSYAGDTPAIAIAPFEELQRPVWEVKIVEEELGWVIRVPRDDLNEEQDPILPIVGSRPLVQVGDVLLEFEVVQQMRMSWRGTSKVEGKPVKKFEPRATQMWHCASHPQAIGNWIKSHIDFAAYARFYRSRDFEEMLDIGLSEWLFQTENGFRLQFDFFQTSEYALNAQP